MARRGCDGDQRRVGRPGPPRAHAGGPRPIRPCRLQGAHSAAVGAGASRGHGWAQLPDDLRAQFTDEVNVLVAVPLAEEAGDLVEVSVKPNFRALGKRFGKGTPAVAEAIGAADAASLAAQLRAGARPSSWWLATSWRSPAMTSSSPNVRWRVGASLAPTARPWRWTCNSTTTCAGWASPARSCAPTGGPQERRS